MNVSRLLLVAALTSACGDAVATQRATPPTATPAEVAIQEGERKTSTDPAVNPNAAAMAEFKARVEGTPTCTSGSPRGLPRRRKPRTPPDRRGKTALAAKVQAARADAKHGDIFTPAIRPVFRRLLAPELKGEDGRDAKAIIKDDAPAPGTVPFKVNAKYPENQPLPTVPANLLLHCRRCPRRSNTASSASTCCCSTRPRTSSSITS